MPAARPDIGVGSRRTSDTTTRRLSNRGALILNPGGDLNTARRKEVTCLTDALGSGGGAELKVQALTEEGDPITTYYRVAPDRTTEAYIDSTADAFGVRKWTHTACKHPRSVLDISS